MKISRKPGLYWLAVFVMLTLAVPMVPATANYAQGESRLFSETGKTVSGTFLQYWDNQGGLSQQGFPISEEMQEVSDTDGKSYTVQYFERAVFEMHPENAGKPSEVLLSLLGVFYYAEVYPQGAPNQIPNNEAGSVLVPETNKRLGGIFLDYWKAHGGLAQQGYPISDEFNEVSSLDGKTYKVQYFERAVFEYHPEEAQPQYRVLLSQLGTFRHKARYEQPATPTAVATPIATSIPQPASTQGPGRCSGIPDSVNGTIVPDCGGRTVMFVMTVNGFTPGETVKRFILNADPNTGDPGERDWKTLTPVVDAQGNNTLTFSLANLPYVPGIYRIRIRGEVSGHEALIYFKYLV